MDTEVEWREAVRTAIQGIGAKSLRFNILGTSGLFSVTYKDGARLRRME
jgi:hypothetical protein